MSRARNQRKKQKSPAPTTETWSPKSASLKAIHLRNQTRDAYKSAIAIPSDRVSAESPDRSIAAASQIYLMELNSVPKRREVAGPEEQSHYELSSDDEIARKDLQQRVDTLEGNLFIIAPDMLDTLIAAALTLTDQDVEEHFTSNMQVFPSGTLFLPRNLTVVKNAVHKEHIDDMEMIGWHTQGDSVMVAEWRDLLKGFTVHPEDAKETQRAIRKGASLSSPYFCWNMGELNFSRYPVKDWKADHTISSEDGEYRRIDEIIRDRPEVNFFFGVRLLLAFMLLLEQKTGHETEEQVRTGVKHTSKEQPSEHVRIIELRRAQNPLTDDSEKPPKYHHRWMVRMHKRRQWYPSIQEHKLIFVGPYIKGPDGKPFLTGEKVYSLPR